MRVHARPRIARVTNKRVTLAGRRGPVAPPVRGLTVRSPAWRRRGPRRSNERRQRRATNCNAKLAAIQLLLLWLLGAQYSFGLW
eukprot:COSAG02_NODE_6536_length_3511_cov_1.873974_5_plen_84_part_00